MTEHPGGDRFVSEAALRVHAGLVGRRLASPARRIIAFAVDLFILLAPSVVVAVSAAALSLWIANRQAFDAVREEFTNRPQDRAAQIEQLGRLAPLLVWSEAAGLPPSVAVAVREADLHRAGEILFDYRLVFALGTNTSSPPNTVRVEIDRLIPGALRGAALFGTAAVYFTICASGRRRSTLGKRLMGTAVVKLDGEPLTAWESFERFGGYFASLGTLGLGLLDLWRDPNRRLSHDRTSNTVVVRRS